MFKPILSHKTIGTQIIFDKNSETSIRKINTEKKKSRLYKAKMGEKVHITAKERQRVRSIEKDRERTKNKI